MGAQNNQVNYPSLNNTQQGQGLMPPSGQGFGYQVEQGGATGQNNHSLGSIFPCENCKKLRNDLASKIDMIDNLKAKINILNEGASVPKRLLYALVGFIAVSFLTESSFWPSLFAFIMFVWD